MKRILIIRFSALGDVAILVPVVRALAEQYPKTDITVLSHHRMHDLFADLPDIVHFYGVDTHRDSLRSIIAGLGRFDVVADMHDVWRSRYICWRMNLRGTHSVHIRKGRWDKYRLTHGWIHHPLTPTIMRYTDVLRRAGLPVVLPEPTFHTTGTGIGIAPFAAHEGKRYPLAQMEEVVRLLSERGETIVLFGSKDESALLEQWAQRYPHVENAAGRYTLREELERMSRLKVILSMDSSNMHLASLVGTRVISIWGATHPYAGFTGWGQAEQNCIQRDLPCRPCSVYGNKRCRFGDYRCMAIPPQEIVQYLL